MSYQNNIPQLRFTGFVGEWEKSNLNKFASLNPKNSVLPESFIYIDLESVTDGLLTKESVISKNEAPSRAQRVLKDKDILYQTVRPYQKNNLYFEKVGDYVASTGYAQIRTKNNSQFLFQFLHTEKFVANVMLRCTGTSYPAIKSSDLSSIEISYPSLPEQQKIASFLSAVDEKIQQLTRKVNLLEQYKKGLMQQLFSGKLRFKDENGKDYSDWEKKKLGELTKITTGGTPNTFKKEYWGGNIRWMNSGELNLKIVKEVQNRITEEGLKNSSTKMIPLKCILIGLAGQGKTRGTAAMNLVELCTNQSIASILPNYEKFVPEYLYQNIDQRYDELRGLSTGDGGRGGLNLQIIKSFKINLPSLEEQQKIANFLSNIDEKIESTNQQINQTQSFKKGLLQQMFV